MSFGDGVRASCVTTLFGVLLIPGSIALHAWNEYRTIHRSRGLKEAAGLVQSVTDPQIVDPELDKQFVHVTGKALTEETLQDELFGVRKQAIHLARRVEMYQWVEDEEENSEGHKSYNYSKEWASGREDSDSFHQSDYDNPQLKFSSKQSTAASVQVGAYQLNSALKHDMDNWEPYELNQSAIFETIGEGAEEQFLVSDNRLYWSTEKPSPDNPEVGDIRMQFEFIPPSDVSLVAAQNAETFDKFTTSNGETIQRLYVGTLSADDVMQKLMTENKILAWVFRFVGLALCVIGFSCMLRPLAALVSWIPFLGDLAGFALFLAGAACAVVVSLTTIAISWVAVRPLLAVVLLLIAGFAAGLVYWLSKSSQPETNVASV